MRRIEPDDNRLCWEAPLGLARREGGFSPARFPPELVAAPGNEGFASRMRCAAGCSLRMVTDARKIAFDIRVIDTPRDWGCFVARCKGEVIGLFEKPDFAPGKLHISLDLDGGGAMREIEVLPPHLVDFAFESVTIEGALDALPGGPPPPVWLALGDSITQGMNASRPDFTYVQRVRDALSIGAWNLGIGGSRMEPASFEWAFARRPWRIITVALGTNDCVGGVGLGELRRKTGEMIECAAATAPQARVLLITPPPVVKDDPAFSRLDACREAIAAAAAPPCTVLDGCSLVDPEKGHFTPDGVHLSDDGFAAYAAALLSAKEFREALVS